MKYTVFLHIKGVVYDDQTLAKYAQFFQWYLPPRAECFAECLWCRKMDCSHLQPQCIEHDSCYFALEEKKQIVVVIKSGQF